MRDPYIVLGVSRNATDEEITKTYRELAKKYHPDNYVNSPLATHATEKMQEINEAYEQIKKERKNSGNYNQYGNSGYNYGYGGNSYNYNGNNYSGNNYGGNSYSGNYNDGYNNGYTNTGGARYYDVRMMIKSGRLADADQILSGVPNSNRDAEWYFLKGTVLYRKGWTDQASMHFHQAVSMDPNNGEYQAAVNQMNSRRDGAFGGYNSNRNMNSANGCSSCDVCTSLLCADCCCECMGCDLISCC
ncbi:MAG: J domain-containing protein [Acutalibacteraceae bacterium]